ncbi:MAG TPA: c-type cytochrome, partial [Acidobacteriota bacterium]|nr:c-type cytochrome [Acidobacteriota bacterium]
MQRSTALLTLVLAALNACGGGDPVRGRRLLEEKACTACHSVGGGDRQGPDLAGVADKYDRERLRQWLHDPEVIYQRTGKTPINEG